MAMPNRRMRLLGSIVAGCLGLLTLSGSVAAAKPEPVSIDSTMYVAGPPPNSGTFTRLSGSNLICSGGSVIDTRSVWGASQGSGGNPQGVQLQVDKTFSCPTGDIYLRLEIRGVFVSETFTWVVLGGTGAYVDLHGRGDGWTDYSPFDQDGTVINHYVGDLN